MSKTTETMTKGAQTCVIVPFVVTTNAAVFTVSTRQTDLFQCQTFTTAGPVALPGVTTGMEAAATSSRGPFIGGNPMQPSETGDREVRQPDFEFEAANIRELLGLPPHADSELARRTLAELMRITSHQSEPVTEPHQRLIDPWDVSSTRVTNSERFQTSSFNVGCFEPLPTLPRANPTTAGSGPQGSRGDQSTLVTTSLAQSHLGGLSNPRLDMRVAVEKNSTPSVIGARYRQPTTTLPPHMGPTH